MMSRIAHKVAKAYREKKAGWWTIDEEGHMSAPDEPYGNFLNAVPGFHQNTYEFGGDRVADVMGAALDEIYGVYQEAWDRPPTDHEMESLFKMSWRTTKEMAEKRDS